MARVHAHPKISWPMNRAWGEDMLLGQFDPTALINSGVTVVFGLVGAGIAWIIKRVIDGNGLEIKEAVKNIHAEVTAIREWLSEELKAVQGQMTSISNRLSAQENKLGEMGAAMSFLREEQTRYRDHMRRNDEHVQQLAREVARLQGGLVVKPTTIVELPPQDSST